MDKTAKTWLIMAAFLVLIGFIIFGGVMTVFAWDFTKITTNQFETNIHDINESFRSISIDSDTANITFVPSQDTKCTVVCYEQKNVTHFVSVKDDTLVIKVTDSRKWYEHIGIQFGTPEVTVYLPEKDYAALSVKESTGNIEIPNSFRFEKVDLSLDTGDVRFFAAASGLVRIAASTGNITVENTSAGELTLSTSTGRITVSNVICEGNATIRVSTGKTKLTGLNCKNLISTGNTGSISLDHVLVGEMISIQRTTGSVRFDCSDASEIFVETDTGDVTGTFLSEKIFIAETNTGHIAVPKGTAGGRCKVTTATGDIKLDIP